jgi:hypothetical protein
MRADAVWLPLQCLTSMCTLQVWLLADLLHVLLLPLVVLQAGRGHRVRCALAPSPLASH